MSEIYNSQKVYKSKFNTFTTRQLDSEEIYKINTIERANI
ncbi:16354_t:CDS:2 [Racocetra fulgida]|uniref:16354_t:CDS:1 n=1 Tax=Racocetra fulgida TaxID=60492 RepID=A0A9N8ZPZ0_9GLOM|nr:16354_t:CDS:2 [Racocetra fulgida]